MTGSSAAADAQTTPRPWLRYVALVLVALVMLYPLIWLVGASFKTNREIFTEVGFWPQRFDFGAYAKGWKTSTEYTFATYFLNSFLITIPRIIVTVISCVLVAYAFARFEFFEAQPDVPRFGDHQVGACAIVEAGQCFVAANFAGLE